MYPKHEYPEPRLSRSDIEFSLVWAYQNPELFRGLLVGFSAEHPASHWRITMDNSRTGFLTYVAVRREDK